MFMMCLPLLLLVVLLLLVLLLSLLLLLLLLWISFLVIDFATIAIFYLCYQWSNNYCYSCHHTDVTSSQILTLNYSYVPVDSHMFYKNKVFLRDRNGNKATIFFLCYPCQRTLYIFSYFILHYSSVFDCKFIWKNYVHFSLFESIFVILTDWLTDWRTDWLADWLTDWLTDWVSK